MLNLQASMGGATWPGSLGGRRLPLGPPSSRWPDTCEVGVKGGAAEKWWKWREFFRGPLGPYHFFPNKQWGLKPEGMVVHNPFWAFFPRLGGICWGGPLKFSWTFWVSGRGRGGCKFYFVKTWCKSRVFTDFLVVQAPKKIDWRKDQAVLMKYFFESGCFNHHHWLDVLSRSNSNKQCFRISQLMMFAEFQKLPCSIFWKSICVVCFFVFLMLIFLQKKSLTRISLHSQHMTFWRKHLLFRLWGEEPPNCPPRNTSGCENPQKYSWQFESRHWGVSNPWSMNHVGCHIILDICNFNVYIYICIYDIYICVTAELDLHNLMKDIFPQQQSQSQLHFWWGILINFYLSLLLRWGRSNTYTHQILYLPSHRQIHTICPNLDSSIGFLLRKY